MKKILLIALLSIPLFSFSALGIQFGMAGAVKVKVQDLDSKVKTYKEQQQKQQQEKQEKEQLQINVISGVAAHGSPFANLKITLRDLLGNTTTTMTDTNGNFTCHVSSFPVLMKVTDTITNRTNFSIAFSSGTTNIHPLTDIIVRDWMRITLQITDLKTAFESSSSTSAITSFPTLDEIQDLTGSLADYMSDILYRNNLDPATFELFTSKFQANGQGFDNCLLQTLLVETTGQVCIIDSVTGSSSTFVVPLINTVPAAPTNLRSFDVAARSLMLTWNPAPGAAGYAIFRNGVKIRSVYQTYFADYGLTPSTQYTYYVESIGWGGKKTSPSTSISITTRTKFTIETDALGIQGGDLASDGTKYLLPYIDLKEVVGTGQIKAQFINADGTLGTFVHISSQTHMTAAPDPGSIAVAYGTTNYFLIWVTTTSGIKGTHIDSSGNCDSVFVIAPDNTVSPGHLGNIVFDTHSLCYFIPSEYSNNPNWSIMATFVNQSGGVVGSGSLVSSSIEIPEPPRAALGSQAGNGLNDPFFVTWSETNKGIYGGAVSLNGALFAVTIDSTALGTQWASVAFDGTRFLVAYKANPNTVTPTGSGIDTVIPSFIKGRFVDQSGNLSSSFDASVDPLIAHYVPYVAFDSVNDLYLITWSNNLYTSSAITRAGLFDTTGQRKGELFNTDYVEPGENVVISEPFFFNNNPTTNFFLGIYHGVFDSSGNPIVLGIAGEMFK